MLLHGPDSVEWLEPPAGPALGLGGTDWPLNELELPAGHGLVLLTDGLFEGHSGRRQRATRRGRAARAGAVAWPACPARRSSTRSSTAPRSVRAAARRAQPTTSPWCGWSGPPDDAPRPRRTPRRSSPLTVQGWQTLVLSIMGVLVLGGGIAGALLLNRYRRGVPRADRRDPAGARRRPTNCRRRCATRRRPSAGTPSPPTASSSTRTTTGQQRRGRRPPTTSGSAPAAGPS